MPKSTLSHHLLAALFSAAMLFSFIGTANAETASIQNKWKSTYLDANGTTPVDGNNAEATWEIEHTGIENFVRLRSGSTGGYLHIEHGTLEVGAIEDGWWSAMWTLDPVDSEFSRLCNRWKSAECVHNETGNVAASAVQPGWWSAMWRISTVSSSTAGSDQSGGSMNGGTAEQVMVEFQNMTGAPIDLYTGDTSNPEPQGSIPAGSSAQVATTPGTTWLIAQGGQWLGAVDATTEPSQVVPVE